LKLNKDRPIKKLTFLKKIKKESKINGLKIRCDSAMCKDVGTKLFTLLDVNQDETFSINDLDDLDAEGIIRLNADLALLVDKLNKNFEEQREVIERFIQKAKDYVGNNRNELIPSVKRALMKLREKFSYEYLDKKFKLKAFINKFLAKINNLSTIE